MAKMFTGTLMESGEPRIIEVTELKDIALRYWLDGWLFTEKVTDNFIIQMERALRQHKGIKAMGVQVPEGSFLEKKEMFREANNGI